MNIFEAKQEIKNTLKIYLNKNEFGEYAISRVRQRPILLIGAPGLGKTAIMAQIAKELAKDLYHIQLRSYKAKRYRSPVYYR
jgi:MoxR-like ATPase